jgi:hypothetical protein
MATDARTKQYELTPVEAAVVGYMRRNERAKKAIFNYARKFSPSDGSVTSGP